MVDRTAQRRLTRFGHVAKMGSERLVVKMTDALFYNREEE